MSTNIQDFLNRYWRPFSAFLYRRRVFSYRYIWSSLALTSRYVIQAAAIGYIGVAYAKAQEAFALFAGIILWGFLNTVLTEAGNVIEQEHFEGTLENTLALPCPRVVYLAALSFFGVAKGALEAAVCVVTIALLVNLRVPDINIEATIALFAASTLCFVSVGIVVGGVALVSKVGNRFANLIQGPLLLLSGVYFPIEALPPWLRALSPLSPATHVFDVARMIVEQESMEAIATRLIWLAVLALVSLPLSCLFFRLMEKLAKKAGLLQHRGG